MQMMAAFIDLVFGFLFLFGVVSGRLAPRNKNLGLVAAAFGVFLIFIGLKVIFKKYSKSR